MVVLLGEGRKVKVMVGVSVGRGVLDGVGVEDGVRVFVGIFVNVGVADGINVGGVPCTRNLPLPTNTSPTKIWTSYIPGNHLSGDGFQSVKPDPPVAPSHGLVS